MNLRDRIRELANKNGMSLPNLESELGFGNGTIVRWDASSPSVDKMQKVADYFDVSVDYLLGREENVKAIDEEGNTVVIDDETRELIDSLRKKPEMKMLFSVSKKATKEDIIKTVKIIEALKEEGE